MRQGKWIGAAMLAVLLAGRANAGEFTVDVRFGGTDLRVDGDSLSSGEDIKRGLMSAGLDFTYKWPKGPFVELGLATSFDPFPLFGWSDIDHVSLASGWQFSKNNFHFKPKVGLTRSSLESQQEDFFEGNEPVDRISKVVPFLEASGEFRIGSRFGLGAYVRRNFEDFGETTMFGLSLGWTFD
jgi:hypothetical protein